MRDAQKVTAFVLPLDEEARAVLAKSAKSSC
jgi:hypothetical protein